MPVYARRPEWLRLTPLDPAVLAPMRGLTRHLKLHTVCESARCPNRPGCFAEGTATFMVLGDVCTRNCTFCAVKKGEPLPPDSREPGHIVAAVKELGLGYVVVTSVTRDDLPDGGAAHFARVIKAIRDYDDSIPVEVLIPDFKGSLSALRAVVDASPAVINHNVETVPRLYPGVRPRADYRRSIDLLRQAKMLNRGLVTKSGMMLGLGETREEVLAVMDNLREADCDLLTIGQYLQPSLKHHRVVRYVSPEEFEEYKVIGKEKGFASVVSAPLVRSSYHAAETYLLARGK